MLLHALVYTTTTWLYLRCLHLDILRFVYIHTDPTLPLLCDCVCVVFLCVCGCLCVSVLGGGCVHVCVWVGVNLCLWVGLDVHGYEFDKV